MVRISFLGDISLNNRYNKIQKEDKNPFSQITDELKSSNLIIGNLECISEGNDGENIQKKPRLKTFSETLNLLRKIPVSVVSLAHNHIYDNLSDGYNLTTQILENNNIGYFGAGNNAEIASIPLFKEIKGVKFCFLNYVTQDTNPNLPENAEKTPNFFEIKKTIFDIKKVSKQTDFVIILLHWGGRVENGLYPDWNQPKIARKLIDAGSDLIIGHHSHTMQPFEKYKGKYIFYSLGNFCFDDIIFEDKLYYKISKRNKETIIVNVNFNKDTYSVNLATYKNIKLFLYKNKSVRYKLLFRNTIFKILKNVYPFWRLYFLKLKIMNPIHFFIFRDHDSAQNKVKRLIKKIKEVMLFSNLY